MLTVTCPHCSVQLRICDEAGGKQAKCAKCKKPFAISASAAQVVTGEL